MKSTWDTRIEPVESAVIVLTPAGRTEAVRIQSAQEAAYETARMTLLPCGCYPGACYCGQYPTAAEWNAMQAEADADLPEREPLTLAEEIEAEELRNFFGGRHDN